MNESTDKTETGVTSQVDTQVETKVQTLVQTQVETLTKKELALSTAGATREKAYTKVVEMLDAEVMTLDKFGGEHTAPDNPTQLRAAELISKLNGDLKEGVVVDNRTVNISGVSTAVIEELLHMVKDVSEQLKGLRTSGQQTGEIIDVECV